MSSAHSQIPYVNRKGKLIGTIPALHADRGCPEAEKCTGTRCQVFTGKSQRKNSR